MRRGDAINNDSGCEPIEKTRTRTSGERRRDHFVYLLFDVRIPDVGHSRAISAALALLSNPNHGAPIKRKRKRNTKQRTLSSGVCH